MSILSRLKSFSNTKLGLIFFIVLSIGSFYLAKSLFIKILLLIFKIEP